MAEKENNEITEGFGGLIPDFMLGSVKLVSAGKFIKKGDPWPEGLLGLQVYPNTYVVPEWVLEAIEKLVGEKNVQH